MSVRVGVDVGGTFTDVVLFDESSGSLSLRKVPSTPSEPNRAVIDGARRALQDRGLTPRAVRFFIHGTTVATNALIQRKGADIVLLVTEGFRDVLHIMRQDRARLYDYFVHRPVPPGAPQSSPRSSRADALYRPGPYTLVAGSDRADRRRSARLGLRDIAICLLHSYANPEHEEKLRAALTEHSLTATARPPCTIT